MTIDQKPVRLPIKSSTGDTLALVSIDGLQLYSKRRKCWETFPIEKVLQLQTEVAKLAVEKEETAGLNQ